MSWAPVHTLFTVRYAALYYGRPGGGIGSTRPSRPRIEISPTWPAPSG
jgi:uncharacterized membrane protein